METFDLEPFVNYIKQRNLTDERQLPYYVKWVQRFLTADLPPIATAPNDRILAFENLLSKDHALQDWQIRQALRAVELYVKVFMTTSPSEPMQPDDQKKAVSESERVMRKCVI